MRWRLFGQRLLRRGATWLRHRADRVLARLPVPEAPDHDRSQHEARPETPMALDARRQQVTRPARDSGIPAHWLARVVRRPPRHWLERVDAARRRFRIVWIDTGAPRPPAPTGESGASAAATSEPEGTSPQVLAPASHPAPSEHPASEAVGVRLASREWVPPGPLRSAAHRMPLEPRSSRPTDRPRAAAGAEPFVDPSRTGLPISSEADTESKESRRGLAPASDAHAAPPARTVAHPPGEEATLPPMPASRVARRGAAGVDASPPDWPSLETGPGTSEGGRNAPSSHTASIGADTAAAALQSRGRPTDPVTAEKPDEVPFEVAVPPDDHFWLRTSARAGDEIAWSPLDLSRSTHGRKEHESDGGRDEPPSTGWWPGLTPVEPWAAAVPHGPADHASGDRASAARVDQSPFYTTEPASRWPELPAAPAQEGEDWRALKRTLDRLDRLDREQRGW